MAAKVCSGFHRLSRHHDVRSALENADLRVEHPSLVSKYTFGRTILDIDGPRHALGKRLLMKLFSPEKVGDYRDRIVRRVVSETWASLRAKGRVDLVASIAMVVPPRVIVGVLDLPQDAAADMYARDLAPIARFRENNKSGYDAAHEAHDRLMAMVQRRLSDNSPWSTADDLMRSTNGEITQDELAAALGHLLFAGTETTVCALANLFYFIGEYPSSWTAVLDGRLAEGHFVDEVLRFEPPAPRTFRFAHADTTVGSDLELTRDSIVELCFDAANRSQQGVAAAETWSPHEGRGTGVSFGFGAHACLGKGLALAELLEVTTVLKRDRFLPTAICEREPIQGGIFRRSPRIVALL